DQRFWIRAPGKLAKTCRAPADPSVADVGVQVRGTNDDRIWISTRLSSVEAQTPAANWNAMSRCWPTVVPGLPPTGAAGVGSLKPSPGALTLTMVIVAFASAGPA